ncbi:probable disease resistance protein At4g27220 isoform X2 [Prosopis cineraria]|uniref:probable disease resistance protein At4g27220 isoform X2 n=1 Tax=Prosopis cineraria TaxID=364024 RepID=UPI00240F40E5|nr:probable disease resistance protein At4g27220 isoform X2 [Prosopis cineraria]
MAEIVISVIAKVAEYLVDPVARQGKYLFCAGKITETLETEKQKLESAQCKVQNRRQEAMIKAERIDDAVENWLGEVKIHIDEVQKLEQQMKENNNCFHGRCTSYWKRYCLGKQMAKKIENTKKLVERNNFDPFSVPGEIPDIEYFSSGNFVYFQSTKLASDELLAALQDDGTHMIGLYGMGGSGKTTLIKEVGKEVKKSKLFDRVILATISQNPDNKRIQDEIADMLDLELKEQSEAGRARRLSVRLSSGERILMILDDMWAKIDLKDIGIPFEDYHVGCKVLLTTRRQRVCTLMDCERKIPLHLLSKEESWTLFQKHARIVDKSLHDVAQEIVGECKGLPIAIQAVGASLRGKSIEEWNEALGKLRYSKPIEEEPGVRDAFSCLKLSYDYLRSDESKSLFLMCSMYPEDSDISVEDLFRIAIGVGMCEELGSLEEVRNKVSAGINNLVDSCLLMWSERKKDQLRMHDTIRDVALWISSQENRTILVNLEKDMKVARNESIKDCYAFTSWCNQTSQFPQRLDAPKLEILLFNNVGACELSEANFRGMAALKVMQINAGYDEVVDLSSLSYSMNLLTNLQTLRLQGCQLGDDLSWVLGLKRLEVLDLKGSSFKELPQGLEELRKLKMLVLSSIKEQSFKIVERCTHLEELYASKIRLSRTTLKLGGCYSKNASFPILQRYELNIGDYPTFNGGHYATLMGCHSKVLFLGELKIFALSPFIKDLLQRAEAVFLYRLDGGFKNIVPDIVQGVGRMDELTSLWLHSFSNLECVVDANSHNVDLFQAETLFTKLIKLRLESLSNLKEVWCGPPLLFFFEKLQELHVSRCPMLTSLFPKRVARAVLSLQKLTVESCDELKNIIDEDGDGTSNEIISASNNSHSVFSQLKSLTILDCHKLEYVFPNSCAQGLVQLEEVRIEGASQLKYAFGQYKDEHQEFQMELPILKSLKLHGLKNLLSIFPKNYHSSCPCLRKLHWVECPKFRASCVNIMVGSNINMDYQLYNKVSAPLSLLKLGKLEVRGCSVEDILFPLERDVFTEMNSQNNLISPLGTLRLDNMPELKFVWSGPMGTVSLQNLRVFKVRRCNNLKIIFSPVILRSVQVLEYLEISDCNELEEIMSCTEVGEQVLFPNLRLLQVLRCSKLKCLFSIAIDWNNHSENVLPNLKFLTLEQVPSLQDFCHGLSFSNNRLFQLLGSKLEGLWLGSEPELWVTWRAPSQISNFVHLQNLILSECKELKYVFGEGFHGRTLPMLQYLTIIKCEELEEILREDNEFQTCFPKLEDLRVEHCNKLKCLFSSSSLTPLLPHLERIDISECAKLEELFGRCSEASSNNVNEIALPNLTSIRLEKLPSLDVCNGFKLYAVNLTHISVRECPKFSSIIGATVSIYTRIKGKDAEPRGNNGSQVLDQLPYFFPVYLTLEKLELQQLSELSFICSAFITPSQNLSFQYLGSLTVHGCGKLKCIFSSPICGSLQQLTVLVIRECEEVEEIMQEVEEAQHVSHISFPKLRRITVEGCNKLKCLFRTPTVAMLLPELCRIEVSNAAQMEELFSHNYNSDEAPVTSQHIVFSNLYSLKLSKLPSLAHFCKGFNLSAPYLYDVQINECPKFDFSFEESTFTESTAPRII